MSTIITSTDTYMSGFMEKVQGSASEGGEIPKLKVAKQRVAEALLTANRMRVPQLLGLAPLDLGSVTELPNFRAMLRELLITRVLATNSVLADFEAQKVAVKNLLGTMTLFEQSLAKEEEENAA